MSTPIAFPSASAKFSLPFLYPAQAQKEFFINEALARLDTIVHPVVEGETAEPLIIPAKGECWLVAANPVGIFAQHGGEIAFYDGDQWSFIAPTTGMTLYDRSANALRRYNNGWSTPVSIPAPTGGTVVDAEARQAIVALLQALAGLSLIKEG